MAPAATAMTSNPKTFPQIFAQRGRKAVPLQQALVWLHVLAVLSTFLIVLGMNLCAVPLEKILLPQASDLQCC